jgi:RNA polymerase sigma factor for flagellar operon FliA
MTVVNATLDLPVSSVSDAVVDAAEAAPTPQAALWSAWMLRRDAALRERLLLQYGPLVKYVVGRTSLTLSATMDQDDVLANGTIGLLDAIDRFDPTRGISFESYAIPRIRGAIIDGVRALDPLSRTTRQRSRKIDEAASALEASLGRPATDDEVAQAAGIDRATLQETRVQVSASFVSLDSPVDGDDFASATVGDLIPDAHSPNPVELSEKRELLRALVAALPHLPERERLILSLYYNEELTMKEISRVLEVSESRVCQLHAQALARLRRQLQDRRPR